MVSSTTKTFNIYRQKPHPYISDLTDRIRVNISEICGECKNTGKNEELVDRFKHMTHDFRNEAYKLGKDFLSPWVEESKGMLEDHIMYCKEKLRYLEDGQRVELERDLRQAEICREIAEDLKGIRGACRNKLCKIVDEYLKKFERM